MKSNNIASSSPSSSSSISDSVLNDGNNNRFEDGNNIDDINVSTQKFNELNEEHPLYKKGTEELLKSMLPKLPKNIKDLKSVFNLLLDGKGELPISMFSM